MRQIGVAKRALEFLDAMVRRAKLTHRHHLFVRVDGGGTAGHAQVLPPPHHRRRDRQLPRQLREREVLAIQTSDLLLLELRRKNATPI
ncbi:MAG: hypothetical protein Q8K82_00300 [Gemmatimonadaceae bacterium]|nr:hypothetical protein [Gemmatimonadaceae bacterium]